MTMNIKKRKADEIDDSEFLSTKLQGYDQEENARKCSYVVLKKFVEGIWICNSYKPMYPDWGIDPTNKFKQYKFYRKPPRVYTGTCSKCGCEVKNPYTICWDCR